MEDNYYFMLVLSYINMNWPQALEYSQLTTLWQFQVGSKVKVVQSCPTLCNSMDYTVHEILQARILEWVAIPFSRGSSQLRNQTQVSRIAGQFFTSWATSRAKGLHIHDPLSPKPLSFRLPHNIAEFPVLYSRSLLIIHFDIAGCTCPSQTP